MTRKHEKGTTIWIYCTWKDKDDTAITGVPAGDHAVNVFDPSDADMLADELLTADANSGQKVCAVADGSQFRAGWTVTIKDDGNSESNVIASISGDDLTMTTELANTYTVSDNGRVYKDVVTVIEEGPGTYWFRFNIPADGTAGEYTVKWKITIAATGDVGKEECRFEVED